MKLARKALVAACLALATAPVFADAYSTATFGNLKVTLIDLNLNDGVAASITFLPDPRKFYDGAAVKGEAETWLEPGSFEGLHDDKFSKSAAWGSANISGGAHTETASITAGVTASANGTGFNALSLSGSALATAGHLSYFYGAANVPGANLRNFTLSANTQVVFSVEASMSVSTGLGVIPGEYRDELAWARLGLYVSGMSADGLSEVVDQQEHSLSVGYPGDAIPSGGDDSWSGLISSSFSNLSSQSAGGGFWAYGNIEGASLISAVPEPSTYGMLLGGLGLIGVVARRRRRLAMQGVVVACLAASVGPAFATASSSAVMGNLVITLTDLDANDGISPWLSFTPNSVSSVHNDVQGWGDIYESRTTDDYASVAHRDGSVSRQIATEWSSSGGVVTTAANAAGFTAMSAQGTANSGLDGYGAYFSQAYNGNGSSEFKLSANTQVTFSVMAGLNSSTSMGYNLDADMAEYGYARALLNVGGVVDGVWQNDAREQAVLAEYYVNDDNTVSGVRDSWSGLMTVSFSNTGSTEADAFLQGVAISQGQSAVWDGVTPVPEPETYAMMLAGLALIGAARRRKAGKASKAGK